MVEQSCIAAEADFTYIASEGAELIKILFFLEFFEFSNLLCFSDTFVSGDKGAKISASLNEGLLLRLGLVFIVFFIGEFVFFPAKIINFGHDVLLGVLIHL